MLRKVINFNDYFDEYFNGDDAMEENEFLLEEKNTQSHPKLASKI